VHPAPASSVAQWSRPPVALDARPGSVARATRARVEASRGSVRPEPPEARVASRRAGTVAILATRRPVTHGASAPLGTGIPIVDGQGRVDSQPAAGVVPGFDRPHAGPRDGLKTDRVVALTAIRPQLAGMRIGVAVHTPGASGRK
jgi:hypothetical protein